MFQTFRNAWKIPELKNRLLFTLAILVVYRLGCAIPVPFVSSTALTQMFASNGDMLSYLNMMSGGALARCTLFALGVTPYINASIIVQLLTVAIPSLENLAKEKGAEYLHNMLREIDPKSAEDIHANNIKRVIRALEYYHQTGQKMSRHNEEERQKESPYEFVYFVLNAPREQLYQRIDRRVDQMMSEGLVEEVKRLKEMGCTKEMVSMQGLGYKEILAYLDGEYALDEAVYTIKRDTRHFAKRQLTWFRRERQVTWIQKEKYDYDEEKILEAMISHLEGKIC